MESNKDMVLPEQNWRHDPGKRHLCKIYLIRVLILKNRTMDLQQLNFRHLFAFWRVATEGSLTQAAHALHISQSTLSSQIRHLEGRLGHALFERRGRHLLLTATGRQVFRYAENISGLGEEMLGWLDG